MKMIMCLAVTESLLRRPTLLHVCHRWRQILLTPSFWASIHIKLDFHKYTTPDSTIERACHEVQVSLDRSQPMPIRILHHHIPSHGLGTHPYTAGVRALRNLLSSSSSRWRTLESHDSIDFIHSLALPALEEFKCTKSVSPMDLRFLGGLSMLRFLHIHLIPSSLDQELPRIRLPHLTTLEVALLTREGSTPTYTGQYEPLHEMAKAFFNHLDVPALQVLQIEIPGYWHIVGPIWPQLTSVNILHVDGISWPTVSGTRALLQNTPNLTILDVGDPWDGHPNNVVEALSDNGVLPDLRVLYIERNDLEDWPDCMVALLELRERMGQRMVARVRIMEAHEKCELPGIESVVVPWWSKRWQCQCLEWKHRKT
jgi:hypothetical protein